MSDKKKHSHQKSRSESGHVVAENRKARHRYEILDTLECGVVLVGSEVKSLRQYKVSLDEAYARVKDGEVWLLGCDIPEYRQATVWNHEPKRPRKLLLHRQQIRQFARVAEEKGLTLVPLRIYFNQKGKAKILLGLCRGKKLHDKREAIRRAEAEREIARHLRARR